MQSGKIKRAIFMVVMGVIVCVGCTYSLHARQDSTGAAHTAQDSTKTDSTTFARHSVYFEIAGNVIQSSINYEYRLTEILSLRVGYEPIIMLNTLMGKANHLFEMGIGYAYSSELSDFGRSLKKPKFTYWTFSLAYRYQQRDGGFFFKIGVTPYLGTYSSLWFGISLGHTF